MDEDVFGLSLGAEAKFVDGGIVLTVMKIGVAERPWTRKGIDLRRALLLLYSFGRTVEDGQDVRVQMVRLSEVRIEFDSARDLGLCARQIPFQEETNGGHSVVRLRQGVVELNTFLRSSAGLGGDLGRRKPTGGCPGYEGIAETSPRGGVVRLDLNGLFEE